MADGLCSGSDRKTFVASSMNENVIKSCEKLEKCTKLSAENSDKCATVKLVCAETQKTGLKRDQKMTGTKQQQQQQQQKSMDTKMSNKSASGVASVAMVVVAGTPNKSNNGRAETIVQQQQHSKKKNVGSGGGSTAKKPNSKTGSGVNLTAPGAPEAAAAAEVDPAEGCPDDSPSTKKKRCSDRYDSSESSDSGVATLSCTDSSTASSDASDPGSPYSPVSLGEDVHQSSKANMPPQIVPITQNHHHHQHHHHHHHQQQQQSQQQQHQQTTTTVQHQWPWNASSNNTLSNHNNNNINASNKNSSVNSVLSSGKNKRISVNPSDTNGTAKKVRTSTSAERVSSGVSAAANKRLKVQEESQTKITGFFKSQMKPLKVIKPDINTLVPRSADKYFNVLSGKGAASAKDEKDRKTIAIKKDFEIIDLPPLQTMPPSLKKIERKPAKVGQVAPISRKTSASQQLKPPKKHIAIAPRTAESARNPPNQLRKPPTTTFQIDQAKISQPTVLLTAIRIPQQGNGHQQQLTATTVQQQHQQQHHHQQGKNGSASAKVGSMFQIPVMPNLVQIPNILTTANGTNLVMNNGQLTRMGTGAQYFLNGTVLKLQQISNGHTGSASSANGVLAMDASTLQGNILVKPSNAIGQTMPLAAVTSATKGTLALQQPIVAQSPNGGNGCHQTFIGSQRISANQVLMATASGWYVVNQSADPASTNIPHPAALSPMVCKAARTVTSLAGAINPPVPPLVTLASKHETILSSTAGTKFLNSNKLPTHLSVDVKEQTTAFTDSAKLLSVDVAFTKLKNDPIENSFHVKIPTIVEPPTASLLSSLSPKEATIAMKPCLPSPKSLILEQIQQKTPPFVFTNNHNNNSSYENNLKIECSAITTATATASTVIKLEPFAELLSSLKVTSSAPTINTCETQDTSLPKCAISPILSQPKTIRFPVPSGCEAGYRFGPKGPRRHDGVCYWDKCSAKYDTSSKLLDHLQTQHVNTQTGPFSCLWSGCKVRGRESCSRRWLERHVLSHGGTKPFKCIVDGCGLRFGSQLALQKHVNGHFTTIETKDNPNKRTSDPPVPKLLRKNGKKLRYRRQPFSARMFDYFDAGIMEGLQHRLMVTGSLASGIKGSVTFQGRTIARRKTLSGTTELFVKWSPHEILPDEWIPETTKTSVLTKTVTIQSMRCQERFALEKYLGAANLKSDIIHNSVSKSQLFPSIAATMTALCSNNNGSSSISGSSSSSSTRSSNSSISTSSNETKTCGRKQSRKPPKRNQIQPS